MPTRLLPGNALFMPKRRRGPFSGKRHIHMSEVEGGGGKTLTSARAGRGSVDKFGTSYYLHRQHCHRCRAWISASSLTNKGLPQMRNSPGRAAGAVCASTHGVREAEKKRRGEPVRRIVYPIC